MVILKQHIQNILHLKRVLEFIGTVPFQEINVKKLQDRLEKKKMETERCKELRMMLYSDMKEGIVSKEDYVEFHAAYGKRLRNAEESIQYLYQIDHLLKADGITIVDRMQPKSCRNHCFTKARRACQNDVSAIVQLG